MKNALFCFLLLAPHLFYAQTIHDNVIITHSQCDYAFQLEGGKVVVKEKVATDFLATRLGTTLAIYEFYDAQTELDKVAGKKKSTPQYRLYTTDNMFYSDMKVCYFDLYFDRQGSTGEVRFEKTYKNPRYFTTIYFSEPQFVKEKKVTISIPAWMNVDMVPYNFGNNIVCDMAVDPKTGSCIYTYTITDEPAMKEENNMRGRSFIYPHVKVVAKSANLKSGKETFFETLDDLYAWHHHIAVMVKNDQTVIAAQAKQITKDCNNDLDKIKAIYGWVQDNIRYLAFEDGLAAYKPDDAHEVLRKKYGDCKGMANLLKALLEAEGFDARLAWIGTNNIAYNYSTPTLSVDNHMICALYFDNKLYFLDATYKYIPLGEMPESIQGRQTLIEDADRAHYLLERVPVLPPSSNLDSLSLEYTFTDNTLVANATQIYRGESKEVILSLMEATAKDRLNQALKNFLENDNAQDVAKNIDVKGATAQSECIDIHYQFINKSGVQMLGNEVYINLGHAQSMANFVIDKEKRVNDMAFSYRRYGVEHVVLHVPEGYSVTHLPEPLHIEREAYSMQISYVRRGDDIVYERKIVLHVHYLPKTLFAEWNEDIARLKRAYMEQIVLTQNNSQQ